MQQFQAWPPPDWTEVVITWDEIKARERGVLTEISRWLDSMDSASNSRYHLHGWRCTEGFAYRFEDPADAMLFKLRWG